MARTRSPLAATDNDKESAEYADAEYVYELPDAERERRMTPWSYDSWDDVDLDAVECKRYSGSTEGSRERGTRGFLQCCQNNACTPPPQD